MKKILASLLFALLFFIPVARIPGGNQPTRTDAQLLFKGAYQAKEKDDVAMPMIYAHGNGSVNATDLGRFTIRFEAIVHNDADAVGTAVVAADFVAENGDLLLATGTGLGSPTNTPGVNRIVEKYTVTGGTGRFANASGKITVERLLNLASGTSTGSLEGKITLP